MRRISIRAATILLAMNSASCGADDSGSNPSLDTSLTTTAAGPYASASAPAAWPETLRCVSAPVFQDAGVPWVLRGQLVRAADGTGSLTLSTGPQFTTHAGTTAEVSSGETMPMTFEDDAGRSPSAGPFQTQVSLQRDGAVLRGSLVEDQCYLHIATELTCWNDLELFGSPWAISGGLLPAHFDWESGTCVDLEGARAHNPTPIEVVRETGRGECADLRGQALNAGDRSGPDLDGWNLTGARLDGARLSHASLHYASLEGADLSALDFSDAVLDGSVDEHTVLPDDDGSCKVTESPWSAPSVSCAR
jgi:pentapeptide repeat protein